eukprot:CAMPEP_0119311908 /NCGR_PEP_ID=MMETSP1333-20130426/24432_1 /TAXON_ID=418940 /ORGANISM="Scyphosphaera apsteinii, Strain RCC1455" /LENGTH=108 /DNA_ID=CAMNT_0007316415 /DNA_START=41 /DNA_END=367 /DNA_ORIENTATION=+
MTKFCVALALCIELSQAFVITGPNLQLSSACVAASGPASIEMMAAKKKLVQKSYALKQREKVGTGAESIFALFGALGSQLGALEGAPANAPLFIAGWALLVAKLFGIF